MWWCCRLQRSHRCAVVRGCAGNGHSPGGTLVAQKVDSSPGERCAAEPGFPRASRTPGERCAEEPGYIRPVLVTGPPVYALVVTGSLLFRISPQTCTGCLRPPLLCQLMWFGDGSSKAAVSTLLCGGVAVCHGRTGARLFADARGMDIPRAGHWLRRKLILPRARGARQNRVFPGRAIPRVRGARKNRAI